MASKQFDHLQESSLQRIKAMIPPDCPLLVRRIPEGGFVVSTIDGRDELEGRFQVVAAYACGFVTAWHRLRPHPFKP